MTILVRSAIAILFCIALMAQQPAAAPAASLTVDNVIRMAQAGLSDDVIITRIRKDGKPFDLSADDMIRLKEAKVSDSVLKTMLDPSAGMKAETTVAAPAPAAVAPAMVIQAAGAPRVLTTNPSGATPAPGTNAAGDPNDPMVPHDSGIYL